MHHNTRYFSVFLYLNQKLKLQIYNENKNKSNKIIIFPTLKSLCLSIVLYIYLGGGSFFTIYMLLTIEVQNIILFITLFVIFLFFLFLNMCSLYDNKVHVLFKSMELKSFNRNNKQRNGSDKYCYVNLKLSTKILSIELLNMVMNI